MLKLLHPDTDLPYTEPELIKGNTQKGKGKGGKGKSKDWAQNGKGKASKGKDEDDPCIRPYVHMHKITFDIDQLERNFPFGDRLAKLCGKGSSDSKDDELQCVLVQSNDLDRLNKGTDIMKDLVNTALAEYADAKWLDEHEKAEIHSVDVDPCCPCCSVDVSQGDKPLHVEAQSVDLDSLHKGFVATHDVMNEDAMRCLMQILDPKPMDKMSDLENDWIMVDLDDPDADALPLIEEFCCITCGRNSKKPFDFGSFCTHDCRKRSLSK